MTKDFILDCEAFDLVGEAMFGADWVGLGIEVQPGTLHMIGRNPFAEMALSEIDREQHKVVRDWMNEWDFIGEKHDRIEFDAALAAIASASGAVGPREISVGRPDATAPLSDRGTDEPLPAPMGTSEAGWKIVTPLTRGESDVFEIIKELWPSGLKGCTAGDRDRRIAERLKAKRYTNRGPSTIKRVLQKVRFD
jgi:hypothetical protein